jgi:hypothetical protein
MKFSNAAASIAKLIDAKLLLGSAQGRGAEDAYAFARKSGGISVKNLEDRGFNKIRHLSSAPDKLSLLVFSKLIPTTGRSPRESQGYSPMIGEKPTSGVTINVVFDAYSGFGSIGFIRS